MSDNNFLRAYELIVSRPPIIVTEVKHITPEVGSEKVVDKDGDYRSIDLDEAVVLTDLSFKGRIASNKQAGKGQPFSFTISGFSKDTQSYFQKNSVVILKAGYKDPSGKGGDLPILFVGQIFDFKTDHSQDIPTLVVTCSEGYTPSSSVKVTKSFPKDSGITYLDVLQYLADTYAENGLPLGRELSDIADKRGAGNPTPIDQITLNDGYNIQGVYLDKALSTACKEVGYTYYFNKGRLYIEPQNYISPQIEQFKITLRQAISLDKTIPSANTNSKDTQEAATGYKFKTFLDGRMDVGDMVDLEIPGRDVSGTFKIVSISYEMDYEGQDWYNFLEVQNNA